MKKTQIIEVIKNIKKSSISFISIAVFVMLGIAIYTGVDWIGDSLIYSAENAAEADFGTRL